MKGKGFKGGVSTKSTGSSVLSGTEHSGTEGLRSRVHCSVVCEATQWRSEHAVRLGVLTRILLNFGIDSMSLILITENVKKDHCEMSERIGKDISNSRGFRRSSRILLPENLRVRVDKDEATEEECSIWFSIDVKCEKSITIDAAMIIDLKSMISMRFNDQMTQLSLSMLSKWNPVNDNVDILLDLNGIKNDESMNIDRLGNISLLSIACFKLRSIWLSSKHSALSNLSIESPLSLYCKKRALSESIETDSSSSLSTQTHRSDASMMKMSDSTITELTQCINVLNLLVLSNWKTAVNLGNVFRFIHCLKQQNPNIVVIHTLSSLDRIKYMYENQVYSSHICEEMLDYQNGKIDVNQSIDTLHDYCNVIIIRNTKEFYNHCEGWLLAKKKKTENNQEWGSKVTLLIMLDVLLIECIEQSPFQSDVMVMETVKVEDCPPMPLMDFTWPDSRSSKKAVCECNVHLRFGIVGRENIGFKPKYLHRLLKATQTHSHSADKSLQICFVRTNPAFPSLNASVAASLLIAHTLL